MTIRTSYCNKIRKIRVMAKYEVLDNDEQDIYSMYRYTVTVPQTWCLGLVETSRISFVKWSSTTEYHAERFEREMIRIWYDIASGKRQ